MLWALTMTTEKLCTKCTTIKLLHEFTKDKQKADGYTTHCKACRASHWHKLKGTVSDYGPPKPPKPRKPKAKKVSRRKVWPANTSVWYRRSEESRAHQQFLTTMRSRKLRIATPKWADRDAMEMWYIKARRLTQTTGVKYHVDHVIPIRHPYVCGLNVETNMQVLPASDNIRKGNRLDLHTFELHT